MLQFPIDEASKRLPQLIHEASKGEDVFLTENDHRVAKLVGIPQNRPRPIRGSAKGIITYIAPDFDAPLEDFKEYM